MIVAHIGPPAGQQGGPAGYLAQLDRAIACHGAGNHRVLLPAPDAAAASGGPRRRQGGLWTRLRRLRRTVFGAPPQYRPPAADLVRVGGAIGRMIDDAWAGSRAASAPSLEAAQAAAADVLFAHDAPGAEAALARRRPGQQVWLFLHTPMPLALYLAWSWGVPEEPWTAVRAWPDVQAGIMREIEVIEAVDRVLMPAPESAAEWVRVHAKFERLLADASWLLTGTAGPPRRWPGEDRARLRARWGLPRGKAVGLFLGNQQPYRGLDALLEALPRVADGPGVVAVAGVPRDQLPIQPRLLALGRVAEVSDLLEAVDFVINVNRFNLLDLSIIEALERGRPLLLHATGGNTTVAGLGAGASLLADLAPDTIAAGLTRLFGLDAAGWAALAERSRACYDAHFTLRHLRDRHIALYDAHGLARA